MNKINKISTDVLIVGGGSAAAMAAIRAQEHGAEVILITKSGFPSGCSSMARSGFQAAFGHSNSSDSPDIHYQDTIKAGLGLNNPKLVRKMADEIIRIVKDLDKWGTPFIKDGEKFNQRHRVGCTYPRHIHHYDSTGKVMMQNLKEQVLKRDINVLSGITVIDLLSKDGHLCGAIGFDEKNYCWLAVRAKSVVLATGGAGHLYSVSDNPRGIVGDGYSIALRQGVSLIDMEMIDFQLLVCSPSAINGYAPNSSAWVADGARFYNGLGERYMKKYQPETLEKSSRAMINRAAGIEIHEGRGTKNGGVYLDTSSIPAEKLSKIGPTIFRVLANNGVNLTYQPMELAPGAHTFLGGIVIDENGATEIPGLFAAGEVAGGVHGANRLGGNAVTDPLVFGDLAGVAAAEYSKVSNTLELDEEEVNNYINSFTKLISNTTNGPSPSELVIKVQNIMSENVGIVRSGDKLEKAISLLDGLEKEEFSRITLLGENLKEASKELRHYFELRNMLLLGKAIALSAIERRESRGTHYRQDFPKLGGSEWIKNIAVYSGKGGQLNTKGLQVER
ncbi:MAG: FAD-binding protein [Peptococcales bacterium]|jgi:fumarate reductase (CoM/CoB) subunit A